MNTYIKTKARKTLAGFQATILLVTSFVPVLPNTAQIAKAFSPSNITVAENTPTGTTIATLPSGSGVIYAFVSGTGSEDNSRFTLQGNNINLNFTPDYENPIDSGDTAGNNTYSIRIQRMTPNNFSGATFADVGYSTAINSDKNGTGGIEINSNGDTEYGGMYNANNASNRSAFAVLTSEGNIKVWGDTNYGGNQSQVDAHTLGTGEYYTKIYSNRSAFAVLTSEGNIKVWGFNWEGGDQSQVDTHALGTGEYYTKIYSNRSAFAALTSEGNIKVWGRSGEGGDQSQVDAHALGAGEHYTKIYSSVAAFAALTSEGNIKVWGLAGGGGDQSQFDAHALGAGEHYTKIYSNESAFAALTNEGNIKVWGDAISGGDQSQVDAHALGAGEHYIKIYSNTYAFAALTNEGNIKVWGRSWGGGDQSQVDAHALGTGEYYTKIYSNGSAFAALTSEGNIKVWGLAGGGGDQSQVDAHALGTGEYYTKIYSNTYAFAALTNEGNIKAWGSSGNGGSQAQVDAHTLSTGEYYTKIYSNEHAFAALTSEGNIKVWGLAGGGGDQSQVDAHTLSTGEYYTKIYSNRSAFAALTNQGKIKVWGPIWSGGSQSQVDTSVTTISNTIVTVTDIWNDSIAVNDTLTLTQGNTGTIDVRINDTLNGNQAHSGNTTVSLTGTLAITGATLDTATGIYSVPDTTPTGTYTQEYELCKSGHWIVVGESVIWIESALTCDTATITITVNAKPIEAVDDILTLAQGNSGSIDVRINDALNGNQAHSGNTEVSLTGTLAITGATLDTATGIYSVPDTTPTGTYTQEYQLCTQGIGWPGEGEPPSWWNDSRDCDTAIITITVNAKPIDAVDDTLTLTQGNSGAIDVRINDTLNGNQAHSGNTEVSLTGTLAITGAILDATTGIYSVPDTTPAGTYTQKYKLCGGNEGYWKWTGETFIWIESTLTCDTATITITVNAKPIDAVDDTLTLTQGNSGSIDVRINDALNGNQAHSGNTEVSLTGTLAITGATLDTATGIYSVPDTTPTGTYTQEYQLCTQRSGWLGEGLPPPWWNDCDTATITITITAPIPTPITICDDSNASNHSTSTGSHVTVDNTTCTYILSFDANSGIGTMVDEVHTGATNITLTANTFTKTGYTFNGWNAENDGTGSGYTDTDSFTMPNANETLYAQWTANNGTLYTVEYYFQDTSLNYPTSPNQTQTLTGTTNQTVDAGTRTFTGYTYNSTNINNVQTGTILANGSLTLKRYYTVDTYTLTFESNGGSSIATQTGIVYNGTGSQPIDPTRNGYIFQGWFTDNTTFNNQFDFVTPIIQDIILYAQWTATPTSITICNDPNATNYNNATGSHVTIDNSTCIYPTPTPTPIQATDDTLTFTGGTNTINTINILLNDTLSGSQAISSNTIISLTGGLVITGATLDPNTGIYSVPTNTNTGTYTQQYQLCEKSNITNCDTATITVTVNVPVTTPTPITICNDPTATNYNSATGSHVTVDNTTCTYREKACKNQNATNYDPDPNKGIDNSLCKYKETTSTTGPGGCGTSCGDHPVVPPFTGSLLNPPSDPEDPEFNARCEALITNLDELKAKTLYYKTFINNTTKQYTDKAITWGQFKRTLEKYEGLLKNTETLSDALQKINKNMNETVERDIAIKILISSLQERYKDDTNFPILPNKNYITSFNDIQPTTLYAPEIQQSYNLCLTHGRNTKDGVPLNQTTGQKDPNAPRLFEPRENITIAETIKVLINMSHSWDNIPGLTGTARNTGIPLMGKIIGVKR